MRSWSAPARRRRSSARAIRRAASGRSCPMRRRRTIGSGPDWDEHVTRPARSSVVGILMMSRSMRSQDSQLDLFLLGVGARRGVFRHLAHPQYGEAARETLRNAQALLKKIVDGRLVRARGVHAFWPAVADGDDIVLYTDEDRRCRCSRPSRCCGSRSSSRRSRDRRWPTTSRPKGSGVPDYLGDVRGHRRHRRRGAGSDTKGNTTTTTRSWSRRWRIGWPKPSRPRLHVARPRRLGPPRSGGDQSPTTCTTRSIAVSGPLQAIPACPDRSEKFDLFALLQTLKQGMELTETGAMTPAASVSGFYFSHPLAKVLQRRPPRAGPGGSRSAQQQPESKGERWLSSNLAYERAAGLLKEAPGRGGCLPFRGIGGSAGRAARRAVSGHVRIQDLRRGDGGVALLGAALTGAAKAHARRACARWDDE